MKIVEAKTKSGASTRVLEIQADELEAGLEARVWNAAAIAAENHCAHWRIRDAAGILLAQGKTSSPMLTSDEAARRSAPREERNDW